MILGRVNVDELDEGDDIRMSVGRLKYELEDNFKRGQRAGLNQAISYLMDHARFLDGAGVGEQAELLKRDAEELAKMVNAI